MVTRCLDGSRRWSRGWIDGMRRDGCGALKTGEPRFGDLGGKIIIVWGMFGNASVYFGSKGKGLVWIQ